jgi:uncharacterized protein (DUF1697 family)
LLGHNAKRKKMVYVALLRGINVGGNKLVSMSDLRDLASQIGLANPRTYVQSGNLVFEADEPDGRNLEKRLEESVLSNCRTRCDVIVRSAEEWREVIEGNPFPREAEQDPGHLLVQFLKEPVDAQAIEALRSANPGREQIVASARHLYITYPDGIGDSKLAATLLNKHLPTPSTGRNWNTVLKLAPLTTPTT